MPLPFPVDWKNPDYVEIFQWRAERLLRLREVFRGDAEKGIKPDPDVFLNLTDYYKDHPAQFIIDWGVTVDPRNVERDMPAVMPFFLFPKQEEFVNWWFDRWISRQDGLVEKSRDMGMSWLCVGVASSMCITRKGFTAGFGSRKEEYVDRTGDPKSLFWKAREFVAGLPVEFRAGWVREKHSPYMRMFFPNTGAYMTGEAGDSIGRGDRTSVYFIDEHAHVAHPEMIEASLAATTNCRMYVSSVNGMANVFAIKRHSRKIPVFTYHWRSDPRKDDKWYEAQQEKLDPVTLAQEVDIDYNASAQGVLIPSAWVQASIDACGRLGITPTGKRSGALDIADEGLDANAFCAAIGVSIEHVFEWSGKGSDIYNSVVKSFDYCDEFGFKEFCYDGDGLGAGVRGDAKNINLLRSADRKLLVVSFRGSESPLNPEKLGPGTDRTNEDFFSNRKAQSWWELRQRFKNVHRWIVEGKACSPDDIISIAPNCTNRDKLMTELSQPTYDLNNAGKIVVNKTPEGSRSPNLADSVMMRYSKNKHTQLIITGADVQNMMQKLRRRR